MRAFKLLLSPRRQRKGETWISHSESEKVKSLSCVQLFVTPWIVAYQDPPSWDFPGKNTGCYFLLQGIFLTQGLNLGLPHCRQTLLPGKSKYKVSESEVEKKGFPDRELNPGLLWGEHRILTTRPPESTILKAPTT